MWLSLARAPGLGPGGRRFESCHPDSFYVLRLPQVRSALRSGRCRAFFHLERVSDQLSLSGADQQFHGLVSLIVVKLVVYFYIFCKQVFRIIGKHFSAFC